MKNTYPTWIYIYSILHRYMYILCFLIFSSYATNAQNVLVASGNSKTDVGGSVSYSIGQLFQENTSGIDGSANQGIQFFFNDATLTIVELKTNAVISTYPNPSTSILNIDTANYQSNTLIYSLLDAQGKVITNGKITSKTTTIHMAHLNVATYILNIKNVKRNTTKSFKIIKR